MTGPEDTLPRELGRNQAEVMGGGSGAEESLEVLSPGRLETVALRSHLYDLSSTS